MESKEFATYNGKYTLYTLNGTVLESNKTFSTSVSGSGYSNQSTGHMNVSSQTTVHDQIFLVDDEGKEHSIRLSDWDIDVKKEHRLTFCWAIRNGKKSGPYLAIFNRTTSDNYYSKKNIGKMFLLPFWRPILLLSLAGICYYFYKTSNFRGPQPLMQRTTDSHQLNEIAMNEHYMDSGEVLFHWLVYLPIALIGCLVLFFIFNSILSTTGGKKFKQEHLYPIEKS